jgi:ComEC/Rec2-related protein
MKYIIWPLLLLLVVVRYFTTRPVYQNGDKIRITSVIYTDPVSYPNSQGVKIANLLIYLPAFPLVSYGDRVVIEGIVDSGKLKSPKLISVTENQGFASGIRNKIITFYQEVLPQPMSGLIAGITLGSKGALTADFYNQTKVAGVAHVIVASGTNVTFVVSFLMGVLTLILTRKKAIAFVILGIIMYLFLSGFEAPLIRAALMSSFIFLSQETGRLVSTWRIFFLSAVLMLIYRPDWVTDIGFILSFVSTGSLMLFEKRIRTFLIKVPEVLKEGLSTSFAAQIGVAPILFVTFGQFNIWSPVINALVLWTVPYIMILGSVGGVAGLLLPVMGKAVLFLSYPFLWWFTQIVNIFA